MTSKSAGPIAGKTAWITGAGGGIGRAAALALAGRGANVALTSRGRPGLERVAAEIQTLGGTALVAPADVGSEAELRAAAADVARRFGRLDVVLVNAGVAVFRPVAETSPAEWKEVLETNLTGAFLTVRASLPLFGPEGGDILTMVSIAGRRAFPNNGAYCASKFGLLGLTEVLRGELAPRGIRMTALIPGATDTPLWDAAGESFDRARMMRPETVARMIVAALETDRSAAVEWVQMQPAGGSL